MIKLKISTGINKIPQYAAALTIPIKRIISPIIQLYFILLNNLKRIEPSVQ
jgi:hypothetical protein